jgi:hypothetical protein
MIPNSYCLIVEGSELTSQEMKIFRKVSDGLVYIPDTNKDAEVYINNNCNIGIGECKLLEIGINYIEKNNIQGNVYLKLSARYRLTAVFSLEKFISEKYCFASVYNKDINQYIFNTVLFSIPKTDFTEFKHVLYKISCSLGHHSMIEKSIKDSISSDKINIISLPLGVEGNISYNGAYFSL